jgi:hypothetical protein
MRPSSFPTLQIRKSFPASDSAFWGASSRGTEFSFKDADHAQSASGDGAKPALSRQNFAYPWADLPKDDVQGVNTWDFRRVPALRFALLIPLPAACNMFLKIVNLNHPHNLFRARPQYSPIKPRGAKSDADSSWSGRKRGRGGGGGGGRRGWGRG